MFSCKQLRSRSSSDAKERLRAEIQNLKIQKDDGVSEKKVVRMFHRFMENMSENASIVIVVQCEFFEGERLGTRRGVLASRETSPKNSGIVFSVTTDRNVDVVPFLKRCSFIFRHSKRG